MKVLYILHTTGWDGSAHSLLNMIHSVRDSVYPIVLFRNKCAVYEYYTAEGIECIVFPFSKNTKKSSERKVVVYLRKLARHIISNIISVIYLYFAFRKRGIDIVHTNSGVTDLGYPLSKVLGARHVVHLREFQDIDFGIEPLTGWKRFFRNLASADARIAITEAVFRHFHLENYENSFRLFNAVLPLGATTLMEKERYFLFCSAFLHEAKGVDFCLEAFARSELRSSGYSLYIIGKKGDMAYYANLLSIINKYGISDNVKFIGAVKDVKPFMERASAFLMCSKNEGFGRVTAEAMFYGCPVIARNSGGSPEFIAHKQRGFLFDTMEDCINCMKEVATTDTSSIVKSAQEFAMDNFSEENYGNKILDIYSKIM